MRTTNKTRTCVNGYNLCFPEVLLENEFGHLREVGVYMHETSGKVYFGVLNPSIGFLELFPTWYDIDIHLEYLTNIGYSTKEVF